MTTNGTNKRFSQILQEEIFQPSASGIAAMQRHLKIFANNIRRRLGAGQNDEKVISKADVEQQEEDLINDTIVELMNKYRQKLMSSHVTERAAKQVLNQLRTWVRQRYVEKSRTESINDKDVEAFSPVVFRQSTENKLEDFERLHALGVIDVVEFYFLFAAYHGETTAYASQLIKIQEANGRKILQRARERVQAYLEQLEEGDLTSPKIAQEKRPPRDIDMNLLMSAIRQVLGQSF